MTGVVALTGGIGAGKTVVSDCFARLGVPVIDTDIIARHIVSPGLPAYEKLIVAFGAQIVRQDGSLDRAKLRALAFSSQAKKEQLDNITHPAIYREVLSQINFIKEIYCLVVIPLLARDSPYQQICHRVLLVSADRELRVLRVIQRGGVEREDVLKIMRYQLSDEALSGLADDVIRNNGTMDDVHQAVVSLHQKYLCLYANEVGDPSQEL